jgi:hypothetical protein
MGNRLASSTVMTEAGPEAWAIPPLFSRLVDDTSLLSPRTGGPGVDEVVARYLAARDGRHGELVGQLACPVSRLPALVAELARAAPGRPVDLSLVVDTGLGAVPKALSTVFSRTTLLAPRTIETAAPPDVDAVWLERVSEFVPEDVVAVVEPRRPHGHDDESVAAWLEAVRRVAEHGSAPKLRLGGPRPSDVPTVAQVEQFVRIAVRAGRGFSALGLRHVVRAGEPAEHGILNLLVAVARALGVDSGGGSGDDGVAAALESTDKAALVAELRRLSPEEISGVRERLSRCGADPGPLPADELAGLGLLS